MPRSQYMICEVGKLCDGLRWLFSPPRTTWNECRIWWMVGWIPPLTRRCDFYLLPACHEWHRTFLSAIESAHPVNCVWKLNVRSVIGSIGTCNVPSLSIGISWHLCNSTRNINVNQKRAFLIFWIYSDSIDAFNCYYLTHSIYLAHLLVHLFVLFIPGSGWAGCGVKYYLFYGWGLGGPWIFEWERFPWIILGGGAGAEADWLLYGDTFALTFFCFLLRWCLFMWKAAKWDELRRVEMNTIPYLLSLHKDYGDFENFGNWEC